MGVRVLIVEDDTDLIALFESVAKNLSIEVSSESDGARGLDRALTEDFQAVVLDISLPSMNGLDICKALRPQKPNLPIIFLTSLREESDVVLGLELGADDYIVKPFRPRELLARIRSLVARYERLGIHIPSPAPAHTVKEAPAPISPSSIYTYKDIVIDFDRYTVSQSERQLNFSTQEWLLLQALLDRPGQAVGRDAIIEFVWGEYLPEYEQLLTRLVWRVREKLEGSGSDEAGCILTVRGLGYRWNA